MSNAQDQEDRRRVVLLIIALGGLVSRLLIFHEGAAAARWNAELGQFEIDGQAVPIDLIRQEVARIELVVTRRMKAMAAQLEAGDISADEWGKQMTGAIGAMHFIMAALAAGGLAQVFLIAALRSRIEAEKRFASQAARKFKRKTITAKSLAARIRAYVQAANVTYSQIEQKVQAAVGKTHAMRILRANESCAECVDHGHRWIVIGEMPPIGTLLCGQYCRCYLEFK